MSNTFWREFYPADVPDEINADKYPSLIEFWEDCVTNYGNRPAYHNMGKTLSYSELDKLATSFANYLNNELGLKKGDSMAIQMPNVLQFPVALFGAIKAGVTVVNTNPLYTPHEMEHQFNDAKVKAIVILKNFAYNLEEILANTSIKHVITTGIGDLVGGLKGAIVNLVVKHVKKMVPTYHIPNEISFKTALKKGGSYSYKKPAITGDDIAFLQYTGGTTGVSKGAMLTHRNIIANTEQATAWISSYGLKLGEEIFITALPLYHIFALTANAFFCAKIGAKSILITNPRDMDGFVKELSKHEYTLITGVNTLFNGLLNNTSFMELKHSTLKIAIAGGMALQKFVAEKWEEATKVRIAEGYGLTEASPILSINPVDGSAKTGTIGMPIPSTEIIILDDDENPVPMGQPGELCAKGPQIMKGYLGREEATANVFTSDGYLKTGDIAIQQEDGFIRIVDRKKEMILVSGFNVYPNEVEDCIASHPKVLEVGVIGVPSRKSTESVKAYIVKSDDSLTEEEIKDYCKEHLTGYKRPKYISFADELPKSNVGKILRRIIKENDLKINTYT